MNTQQEGKHSGADQKFSIDSPTKIIFPSDHKLLITQKNQSILHLSNIDLFTFKPYTLKIDHFRVVDLQKSIS